MNSFFPEAAINTIRANRWELFLAGIFGVKRVVNDDTGCKLFMRYWRGKYYLMSYKQQYGNLIMKKPP